MVAKLDQIISLLGQLLDQEETRVNRQALAHTSVSIYR